MKLALALREHVDVPFWIPHWRLTQPSHDLTDELTERPLQSVFRFIRFTDCFAASPRCETKFLRHTSDVFVCGQVLTYCRVSSIALVDDIDILLEPSFRYVCIVAIRGYTSDLRRIVAVPLADVRAQAITHAEFVMGNCRGLPVAFHPPRVSWERGSRSSSRDPVTSRRAFPWLRIPGRALVNMGERLIVYVSARGAKITASPGEFALRVARQLDLDDGVNSGDDLSPSPGVLLTREETILTPSVEVLHDFNRAVPVPGATPVTNPPIPVPSAPGASGASLSIAVSTAEPVDLAAPAISSISLSAALSSSPSVPVSIPFSKAFPFPAAFAPWSPSVGVLAVSSVRERGYRTNEHFDRFLDMSTQDRVYSTLEHERFRRQYRVTKVTIKMLYALNFFNRPIDHFLPLEDIGGHQQGRKVIHDDAQWVGPEPAPLYQIRRAEQLHHVLHVTQDVAAARYPADVTDVSRSVHGHAIHHVPRSTPIQVVNVMCNLY
ncbi:hypothetical protein BBJ28_00015929 [Nothophytophthora sp. Chile5]|nr:hypothetical protein BBJ28_00015929 [Nothophytophthora sp. Chile5]